MAPLLLPLRYCAGAGAAAPPSARTSATLCIVSLERDGEGNSFRVGVATEQPGEAVDVSRNVVVCARVRHNNYY